MKYSLFEYKDGSSFLHKCPAWCKILFIPVINILFLCLPYQFAVLLVILQFILACSLKFSIKEQLADLKPVLYYAALLLFVQFITFLFSAVNAADFKQSFWQTFSWEAEKSTVFLLIKLFAVMQSASLVFKTSTSLELRNGIGKIFGQKSIITNAISMFLNFIPMVGKIWQQSKRAWKARGGKKGIKMYMTLMPVLFSVGMKKAWNAARAVAIRI